MSFKIKSKPKKPSRTKTHGTDETGTSYLSWIDLNHRITNLIQTKLESGILIDDIEISANVIMQ